MNLQQLNYLSVLAQTQNYTQAAEILCITQPTLSYSITNLEKELGVKLFEKQGRHVKLTAEGKLFNDRTLKALQILHTSVEEAKKHKNVNNIVKISAIRPLFHSWLPTTIKNFINTFNNQSIEPVIEFTDSGGYSINILQNLQAENCDIAFCSKIDNYPAIEYFPIMEQKFVLITPLDHPLANKESINLVDTLSYNYITFALNSGLSVEVTRLFSLCGKIPTSAYAVEEDESVAGMVAAGFGIGIVPEMPVLKTMPVSIIPIDFPESRRLLYMATMKQHYQNPMSRAFIDFVKQSIT
ncbi:LysR family transcriptional regulator [Tetragenococcus halophilus subsp. flandriensis]|uniref:LysR family transcriptional regulator n=1 Tax=Tetragenococcus halophilus TaxID=51669 RepID=UPI0023E97374|nr:LysR family transcriptional regulator [Tetragenococcus halophilus]GMA09403.1 LysR family transcriptional regulator [Tetragenococcus halophilus subsp. flandriensis]